MSSQKEMRRVAAGWIVAAMEDKQAVRNGSVRKLPSHAMRSDLPATFGGEPAVTIREPRSRPLPALVWACLLNQLPKPLAGCRRIPALFRTELSPSLARRSVEFNT